MYVLCRRNIYLFVLASKQEKKVCLRLAFLPVSKARTNKLYICLRYTYVVSHNFSDDMHQFHMQIKIQLPCYCIHTVFVILNIFLRLEKLTMPVLIDRLVLRKLFPYAIKICEYLKVPDAEGKSRILAHWACYKVIHVHIFLLHFDSS